MSRRPTLPSKIVRHIWHDLASELQEIEEAAHNMSLSAANNASNVDADSTGSDEEMDISYSSDLLGTLEKEIQQVCGRLAYIIDGVGPVFSRSKDHAIQGYFMRLTKEIKSMKLVGEKNAQQEKGFLGKIRMLQLQKNSLERAVIGAQNRLAVEEEESKRADEVLERVQEEFTATRKDLVLTEARFSNFPEDWRDISSYLPSHVELLLRDLIIELHPTDSKLARFTI